MSVSFRLGNAGWYCVTKGTVFLGAVLFFCASDISLSENLISERVFFYNSSWVMSILQACFEITCVFLKSNERNLFSEALTLLLL